MLRSYRIVSASKALAPTAEQIASARSLTAIEEILSANEGVAPYEFVKDEELTKVLRTAESLEMTIDTLDNGGRVNRLKAYLPGRANPVKLRGYGTGRGNVLPAKTFTKDEIAKVDFGYCEHGGVREETEKTYGFDGTVVKAPVIYAKIA